MRIATSTLLVLAFAAVLATPVAPALAYAPDSDAPPGAPAAWLPSEDWVMERWLPYSEAQLMHELDAETEQVRSWLQTGRNLAELARRRGRDPRRVVRRLMAPERARVSPEAHRTLRRRAWKTFTQRHLMQHMLFHKLHTRSFNQTLRPALGTSWAQFAQLRARDLSMIEIAARNGRSPRQVLDTFTRALRKGAALGVRIGATSPSQESAWLRAQLEALPRYTGLRSTGVSKHGAQASRAPSAPRASIATAPIAALCVIDG